MGDAKRTVLPANGNARLPESALGVIDQSDGRHHLNAMQLRHVLQTVPDEGSQILFRWIRKDRRETEHLGALHSLNSCHLSSNFWSIPRFCSRSLPFRPLVRCRYKTCYRWLGLVGPDKTAL